MKRNISLLGNLLLLASLIGCMRAPLSIYPAKYWLNTKTGPAAVNINGQRNAGEWGEAYFYQKDKMVSGLIGGYTVEGVVEGEKLYLVISANGTFQYHAILQMSDGVLQGKYGVPSAEGGKYTFDTTADKLMIIFPKK